MSGPLQASPAQINSPSNPRLDPIDSKSSFIYRQKVFVCVSASIWKARERRVPSPIPSQLAVEICFPLQLSSANLSKDLIKTFGAGQASTCRIRTWAEEHLASKIGTLQDSVRGFVLANDDLRVCSILQFKYSKSVLKTRTRVKRLLLRVAFLAPTKWQQGRINNQRWINLGAFGQRYELLPHKNVD